MSELVYAKDGRLLFTKEMKREYTLLMPQMLPVTFTMLKKVLELYGYKIDMLTTTHRGIVETGLRYVHNDTCYPALLVIGQLLEAINSGMYDKHKIGLLISQTGGGCRASNYIHLLRKALEKAGINPDGVASAGMASMILEKLALRREGGLATPKQIRLLENYGFLRVGEWEFGAAGDMISKIRTNSPAWTVPHGIKASEYKPMRTPRADEYVPFINNRGGS